MKKLLGIVVLGLLWCSVGFAQVIKYECKMPAYPKIEYVNYEFDFGSKFMAAKYVFDGNYSSEKHIILEVDNQKVFLKNQKSKVTWYFNYATDQRGHTMSQGPDISHNCRYDKNLVKAAINKLNNLSSSSSSSTDDKIAQAKQICKDLGFKTNTEKFADCSLKMLSMQFEVQKRESSSGGGTQQRIVVNQGYSVGDAMIALSGIISDANRTSSSSGTNCRLFKKHWGADLVCN